MLSELLETDGVSEELVLRGQVGVMALHGGLEVGTSSAARRCAELAGASLYAVVQPPEFRWHVPSTQFDPRQSRKLSEFLSHVRLAASFHGFGRRGLEGAVLVGGKNHRLRRELARGISRRTGLQAIADDAEIPEGLRGTHPRNPVNLPEFAGVQIEMSPQARSGAHLDRLVEVVADVLAAEQKSVCPA